MLNLSALKNVITGKPAALPAASSSPAVEASIKGKQLLKGRTKARVESLRAEVEAARLTLVQAEQAVGAQLVEELDVTHATDAMKQAGDRVRVLEAALAVAVQKDEAAQAELRQAERHALRTALAEAETRLNARGPEGERLFTALEEFCISVWRDKEAVRLARLAAGVERRFVDVAALSGEFQCAAARAGHPLTGTGRLPSRLMGFPSWTACVEEVCGVKAQP